MSAPVQLDNSLDDPRLYAPPWARERPLPAVAQPQLTSSPPVASAPEEPAEPPKSDFSAEPVSAAPLEQPMPRMPKGVGGPNFEWAPRLPKPQPEFEGDIAVRALRRRLALEPSIVPQPPIVALRNGALPWIARLGLSFLAAAVTAFAVTTILAPEAPRPPFAKGNRLSVLEPKAPMPTPVATFRADPARLVVEGGQASANEALPLGVSLQGAAGGEIVLLNGLTAGTRLTSGAPFGVHSWRLMARDLNSVFAYAPRDYVGAMEASIDLRSAGDALLDSQVVRLEWVPKDPVQQHPAPAPVLRPRPQAVLQPLDPEEIAKLLQRGRQFLQTGDIAAARLMLRRAADAGSAPAALALGASFDPAVLREMGVMGMTPNEAQARAWYQKAAELGSDEAPRRIERLQQASR